MRDLSDPLFAIPPRRELPVVLLTALVMTALVAFVVLGGPVQHRVAGPPSVAKLAAVESVRLTPQLRAALRQTRGPTTATVRLPDDADDLMLYFDALDFRLPPVREGGAEVPRVYLVSLPDGLGDLAPVEAKKRLFIRSMLPLVLQTNEDLRRKRRRLAGLRDRLSAGASLGPGDARWLLDTAERYGLAAESPDAVDFGALLARLDVVPPSLAIGQAILESGWGTSRFARQGNALFGMRTWRDETAGLAPKEAEGFKVRAFRSLAGSVRAYAHNLNVSQAYAGLRRARAAMRARGGRIDGYALAGQLQRYSEEGAHYVEKLRRVMAHNGLQAFDSARLRRGVLVQRVVPDSDVGRIQVALEDGG